MPVVNLAELIIEGCKLKRRALDLADLRETIDDDVLAEMSKDTTFYCHVKLLAERLTRINTWIVTNGFSRSQGVETLLYLPAINMLYFDGGGRFGSDFSGSLDVSCNLIDASTCSFKSSFDSNFAIDLAKVLCPVET